jgi:hypothetical protein
MNARSGALENAKDSRGAAGTIDSLSCTFEQAEERNLSAGINASTRAKVEFFEEMIEIGFRFGALKPNGPMSWKEFAAERGGDR